MSPDCRECGAAITGGLDCWGMLGQLIAWEYEDPELLALHFFTVASYNLQHPAQFRDDAFDGLKQLYCEALDKAWSQPEILKAARRANTGAGKVLKKPQEQVPVLTSWPLTIADVCLPNQPEGAPERVRAWVKAIRAQLT